MTTPKVSMPDIFKCCRDNNVSMLLHYLDEGESVNARDLNNLFFDDKFTLLHCAAWSDAIDCFLLLIERGAEVNAKTKYGATALHIASRNVSIKCLEILMENGADIDATDVYGNTPLHDAAKSGNVKCLKILLEEGAKTYPKNKKGKTYAKYIQDKSLRKEIEEYANILSTRNIKEADF